MSNTTIRSRFNPDISSAYYAWLTTTWRDPLQIPVAILRTHLVFAIEDGMVVDFQGFDKRWYLLLTGWSEKKHKVETFGNSAKASTLSICHMQNNVFCFGQTTNLYFYRHSIDAYTNGEIIANVSTSVEGPCAPLLRSSSYLGWIFNPIKTRRI